MTLRLNGSTSGYTEIDAPASAGNNTLVLPTGNGSNGNILGTDGSGNLVWVNGRMQLTTAQNSTSGTAIDFIGLPSWAKRVTVMLSGVSTSGSSIVQIQIGTTGGLVTSGYLGAAAVSGAVTANSSGLLLQQTGAATYVRHGSMTIANITANTWSATGVIANSDTARVDYAAGTIALAGTLDRVRITTVSGTDTFDAGSINILIEG